jgi:hypothetical protein
MRGRRIIASTRFTVLVLLLCVSASVLGLVYAGRPSDGAIQMPLLLVLPMVTFFASHPLGHFFLARAYGVGTAYFFIGRSDFRKLQSGTVSTVGGLVPTIGTKLKSRDLARLSPRKRGYISVPGVIASSSLVGLELCYALTTGFGLLASAAGIVSFAGACDGAALQHEDWDLGKMTSEFEARSTAEALCPRCGL